MMKREVMGNEFAGNGNETRILPPFWERGVGGCYFNTLANITVFTEPNGVCGGILADDMGLGKTLTAIALIAQNPRVGLAGGREAGAREEGEGECVEAKEGEVNEKWQAGGIFKEGNVAGQRQADRVRDGEQVNAFGEAKETSRTGIEDEIEETSGKVANETIEACCYFGDTLVVCPASVISSWK